MTRRFVAAALALSMLTAACGDDSDESSTAQSTTDTTRTSTSGDGPATDGEIFDGDCVDGSGESITIYSGRSEDLMAPIFEAFECEIGIDTRVRYADSTDLALLMGEEGDRTPADVFISRSPGPVGFVEAKGLLTTIDADVLDKVDPRYRSADGTWVGFSGRQRVLVYNVDDVGADELPASIFDLSDERYRNRVAIPATNGSFVDWFTVLRDQFGDAAATQWLDDMVANGAKYYENNRAIVDAAHRGEIDMGLVNHYYNYQEAAVNGDGHRAANHGFADGDIGGALLITAVTITASSPARDDAQTLIDYLLRAPVQSYLTNETFEYPLAAGVEPSDQLPPLAGLGVGTIDFDALGGGFEQTTSIIDASGIAS